MMRILSKARSFSTLRTLPNIPEPLLNLGSRIFNDTEQMQLFGPLLFNKLKGISGTNDRLTKDEADQVAKLMQRWAMERGAINYVHWFSPVRGENAEKHDSFIDVDYETRNLIVDFNGRKLFQGESDGSSFPNGALRDTHRAAAYTTWDVSSPPFLKGDSLYIPSSFIAWTGDSLDEKTPLLRAQEAVNEHGLRLLRAMGDKSTKKVVSNVGWEQEFHVIDMVDFLRRPDLVNCGRTLLGAPAIRGQQASQNYFGSVPLRIKAFFEDVQKELWSVGVSLSTLHNEVSPAQHETAPIFSLTNVAADQNTLTMKILTEMAYRHELAVLLHEKPFMGLNGNGKHNNWSLNTDTGRNLFSPGKTVDHQRSFIAMTAAFIHGVNIHSDVLRASVASAGNDHRLGAQEAPPAIVSVNPGDRLAKHLEAVVNGGELEGYGTGKPEHLSFGSAAVMDVLRPLEDRNRTAPIPFCGNRWELRAVGGGQNINFAMASMNTIMADSMLEMAKKIENGGSLKDVVRETLKANMRIVFNGDGYSDEWIKEAERRKLPNLKNTPMALKTLVSEKNIKLFSSMNVLSERELKARANIMYQAYINQVKMESHCLQDMVNTAVIPALMSDIEHSSSSGHSSEVRKKYISKKQELVDKIISATDELGELEKQFTGPSDSHVPMATEQEVNNADHCLKILDQMKVVREHTDKAEVLCDANLWPFPKYSDMFYRHHYQGERTKKQE